MKLLLPVIAGLCIAKIVIAEPLAEPSDAFLYELKGSMVKVTTTTKSGGHGFGTGIAITKDHVVTNCHVLQNANGISINKWGVEHPAVSLQADWKHDLCILRFEWAELKPVAMAETDVLQYEQPVISISMPNDSPAPYVTLSNIKALYAMDDAEVIRTKAAFSIGASGSPIFDYAGKLIGISTFKSPGRNAYYYNMPVKWLRALLNAPASKLNSEHDLPFWDAPEDARPFFMQIVLPFQNNRWQDVLAIATRWSTQEPTSAEAWYYLGAAKQHLGDDATAVKHYEYALTFHPRHPASLQALGLLAKAEGNTEKLNHIRLALKEVGGEALTGLDELINTNTTK